MIAEAKTVRYEPIERSDCNWKNEGAEPHSLHAMCSRICSFPPAMPSYFIRKFTKEGDVVFDAWSGKGTVPLEALRNNRMGIGNDRSPEAFIINRAKLNPVDFSDLKVYLSKLRSQLAKTELEKKTEFDRKANIFYSRTTFDQIRKIRELVKGDDSDEAVFMKAVMLGILHGKSGRNSNILSLRCSHSYSMSPAYVSRYAKEHGLRRPARDVLSCIENKARLLLKDSLPMRGVALNDDSRKISLDSESVDMILSSPPYFDVQTYAWCNWLRLWFLGYDYRDVKKTLAESGAKEKYRDFMKDSAKELHRVVKPGGRCFIVVGDVRRRCGNGFETINTAEFILPLLEDAGFVLEKIVVDTIPTNKRVITYIGEDEGVKTERIICARG